MEAERYHVLRYEARGHAQAGFGALRCHSISSADGTFGRSAQEERRRQVIGLRQSGASYAAIAAQVGLSQTGVFDICKRFAAKGKKGLIDSVTTPWG